MAETGTKVLPAICTTLTDPEEPVRKQGFKVARGFIDKLQQVSDDPSLKEEMEAEVQKTCSEGSGSTLSAAAGWASWAVGAIGAKFYKSSIPPPSEPNQNRANSASPPPQPQPPSQQKRPQERQQERRREPRQQEEPRLEEPPGNLSNAATDGWDDADDDDWGSLEESKHETTEKEPSNAIG